MSINKAKEENQIKSLDELLIMILEAEEKSIDRSISMIHDTVTYLSGIPKEYLGGDPATLTPKGCDIGRRSDKIQG